MGRVNNVAVQEKKKALLYTVYSKCIKMTGSMWLRFSPETNKSLSKEKRNKKYLRRTETFKTQK